MKGVAIIIVSYNAADVLTRCLAAACAVAKDNGAEVIVVDNDSLDGSADRVALEFPSVRLIRRPNLGFAAGVNRGVAATPARRILLLNPDCFLEPVAFTRSLATLESDPRIAAVSCAILDGDGKPNHSCRAFPTLRQYFVERFGRPAPYPVLADPPRPVDVDTISGAFFFLRREAWSDVGPFDEDFFLYFEETDWCWRAKHQGWRIVHEPRASVVHLTGESTKRSAGPQGAKRLLMKPYLDSRERWWRKCYGLPQTLLMRVASVGISVGSLAAGGFRDPSRRSLEWFRIRHALHLQAASRPRSQ